DLYKTVSAMPETASTAAFTKVIGRASLPKAPAVGASAPAGSTKALGAIPATKVNPATPAKPAPAVTAPRSRAPMLAGVAGVLVLVGGFVAYKALNQNAAGSPPPTPLGQQTGAPVPPTVDLRGSFKVLDALTDFEKGASIQSANQALAKLDSLEPVAQADSDKVHVEFLRAKAHFVIAGESADSSTQMRETKLGCNILQDNEGRASQTRFNDAVRFYLYGDTKKGLAATC
ncbi:MAG: hypothetical protein WD825_14365, partial [Gemmatimonadaceae bacterium]